MRVNFIAESSSSGSGPISLTIRSASGLPGDYLYSTDRTSLLRLLCKETELRSSVLERFLEELTVAKSAHLLGVNISDTALTQIGYFVD
jgi:hypothetical protein